MTDAHHSSLQGEPSAEDRGPADTSVLADRLGGLARQLEAEDDPSRMLDELVTAAGAISPGGGQHPSSDLPEQTVRVPDMLHEPGWPPFAKGAHDTGAGGMLSFQLWVQDDNLGSLNLDDRPANGFDDEPERVGLLVAARRPLREVAGELVSSGRLPELGPGQQAER